MKKGLFFLTFVLAVYCNISGPLSAQESGEAVAEPDFQSLIKKMEKSDEAERLRIKTFLIRTGDAAGPALTEALGTAEGRQADDILFILANLDYPQAGEEIEKKWKESANRRVRLSAAMALCRQDRDYIRYQDFIVRKANEGETKERMQAMQMLGYIKDPRVVPPLKKIFYDQNQDDQIRQAAIWDLAHTPDEAAARALVEMVNDPEVDWFYKEILIAAIRNLASEPEMAPIISDLLMNVTGMPAGPGKEKE